MASDAVQSKPGGDLAVLVLAPVGRDADLARSVLADEGVETVRCESLRDLLVGIERGAGAAVVAEEALAGGAAEVMAQKLESEPNWSDLPVILLTSRRGRVEGVSALLFRRQTTVLSRPVDMPEFLTTVLSAVESRRRQYELRDLVAELRHLNAALRRRARQLQQLAGELTGAEEKARRQMADLLHNDLQQLLVAARLHIDAICGGSGDASECTRRSASEALGLLAEAIEKSRGLSRELSPPILRDEGLLPAMEWLARHMGEVHGLRVDLRTDPRIDLADEARKAFLFRAAQELLFNVTKHAGTDRAELAVRQDADGIEVAVRDDGQGFDPAELDRLAESGGGFGLFSIRERIDLMGGRLGIESAPGGGSRFALFLPPEAAQPAPAGGPR